MTHQAYTGTSLSRLSLALAWLSFLGSHGCIAVIAYITYKNRGALGSPEFTAKVPISLCPYF